ncbi:MAG TPA: septation ring formation regulator EzrA [Bacillales bacterium]|nr:septation ring formation regulator EzrA [Bacillales bacterium]
MGVGLPVLYIIALIVILAAVIFYGTWSRRKIYKHIDRLESWKIEIMNRPVTEEISKVKNLKMYGQTEEKFETWRKEWDDIITAELPDVEEKLYEAEEAADKYRFRLAGTILEDIRRALEHSEKRIEELLQDLNELVSSEKQNRQDIVAVKGAYHEAKKELLTQRRHFQKAVVPIEKELQEIEHSLDSYEQQSEEGNYLEARTTVLEAKERLDALRVKMDAVPSLFTELETELPDQIKDLRDGYHEMIEQGFILHHLMVEDQLESLEKRLASLVNEVEELEIEHPAEEMEDIISRIDMLYDQLEQEAASRNFVAEESPVIKDQLKEADEEVDKLKSETEIVQMSYRIEQEDLRVQDELEKEISQLKKKFKEAEEAVRDQKEAFSKLQDRMKGMKGRLRELEKKRSHYRELLAALRKDELKAKENLNVLRKQLIEAKRMVQKSNLPGIPEYHWMTLESAEDKVIEVEKKLREKPLEMSVVNGILSEALKEVETGYDRTEKLIEDAALAERVIQYGNRYRTRYPEVGDKLMDAESAFRNYQYEEALEWAAEAVQKVEPGILKKFDASIEKEA